MYTICLVLWNEFPRKQKNDSLFLFSPVWKVSTHFITFQHVPVLRMYSTHGTCWTSHNLVLFLLVNNRKPPQQKHILFALCFSIDIWLLLGKMSWWQLPVLCVTVCPCSSLKLLYLLSRNYSKNREKNTTRKRLPVSNNAFFKTGNNWTS